MNVEDLLKLVDAGFTKQEIAAIVAGKQEPKPDEKKEQKPEEKQEQKPEEKKEQKTSTLEEKFDKLMEKLDKANFLGANQPKESTVDDIIASIINPANPFESKEDK